MSANVQGNQIADYIRNFKFDAREINKYTDFPEDDPNLPREIVIGFKVDARQLEFLTWWSYYFYNQKVIDPESRKQTPILDKISPSVLAKLSIKAFIYNFVAYQKMHAAAMQEQMRQQQQQQQPPQQPQNPNQFRQQHQQ